MASEAVLDRTRTARTARMEVAARDPRDAVAELKLHPYFLLRHVHLCMVGDQIVFLDLRRDKYLAISNAEAQVLPGNVDEPHPASTNNSHPYLKANESNPELIRAMLEGGLLTTDPDKGKNAIPLDVEPATAELVDDDFAPRKRLRASHVLSLLIAFTRSWVLLRTRPIERIVDSVQARKRRSFARGHFANVDADRELVSIFNRLRPFVFSQKDQCLLDSLAMIEFLSMHQSFPTWVLGVCTAPFGAHSWIQNHGLLFNCAIETRLRFTPILAI